MKIYNGDRAVDDRGTVTFINDFDFKDVKRFYVVENHHPEFVRAWHGHRKEAKYIYVSRGWAIVAVIHMDTGKEERYFLSASKPQVLYIPPNYYNGFKTKTEDTQIMVFSTSTVEESGSDDERLPADLYRHLWRVEER